MPSATRSIKAKVELDGEKEYKQALQELNTGNRTLASEMKKLQAEYRGASDSTEFLTKKGDLLERQLMQQRDKVQTLRDAVTKLVDQYGESDSRTQEWIQKLNMAEAAEFDLEHQIGENNKALQGQSKEMTGLGDAVSSLTEKLGIHLPKGATNALNGMSKLSTGTVAAMGAAAAGVMALVKSVRVLQEETLEAAAKADDILTKSIQMNISTQQYQALQYASPFVDVDVESMASSLAKITKAMGEAQAGSVAAMEAFSNLGISITNTDGSLRDSYDVWLDTMDALAGMTNETERDVAAQELLGKSAATFAPIYREGTEALREYTAAAEKNYIMTSEQVEALGAVDDAVQHLHLTEEANKNMIAAEWAPTAKAALESFDRLVAAAGEALVNSGLIKGFGELVQLGIALLDPIADLFAAADDSPNHLGVLYKALHGIAVVIATIADAANWLIGLLETLTIVGAKAGLSRMGTAMGYGASSGNYSFSQRVNGVADSWEEWRNSAASGYAGNPDIAYDAKTDQYYDKRTGNYIYSHNAGGSVNWRGGLTWVGEAGPEVVNLPKGTQIHSAQDSRGLGDVFNYNINVNGIEELDQVVRWFESRQVLARMHG